MFSVYGTPGYLIHQYNEKQRRLEDEEWKRNLESNRPDYNEVECIPESIGPIQSPNINITINIGDNVNKETIEEITKAVKEQLAFSLKPLEQSESSQQKETKLKTLEY